MNFGIVEVSKQDETSLDPVQFDVVSQIALNLNMQVAGAHLISCENLYLILVSPDGLVVVVPVTVKKNKDQQRK
ncbi:MAG: hypothetical protein NZO16_05585 [Deltaproteobacteria bacterium]|nr:hypothetical protein [Deltaproteobacteria bacterium]